MTKAALQKQVTALVRRYQIILDLYDWNITCRVVQNRTLSQHYRGPTQADVAYRCKQRQAAIRVSEHFYKMDSFGDGTPNGMLSEIIAHEMLHIWLAENQLQVYDVGNCWDVAEERFCDLMGAVLKKAISKPRRYDK